MSGGSTRILARGSARKQAIMNEPSFERDTRIARVPHVHGYTMIEILVAATISLIIMLAVVNIIGRAGTSISTSRAALEMSDRLREAQARLKRDLQGATATMAPPRDPGADEGYFEYTEGPVGPVIPPGNVARNLDDASSILPDSTVGDTDDMLMFTSHSGDRPFSGRVFMKRSPRAGEPPYKNPASGVDQPDDLGLFVVERTVFSPDAEIAWFLRGRTLYRRVLLVVPQFDADLRRTGVQMQLDSRKPLPSGAPVTVFPEISPAGPGFYADYDISVRSNNSDTDITTYRLFPNTLGDLTKPENRYAHRPVHRFASGSGGQWSGFPFHPHFQYDWTTASPPTILRSNWASIGLPLLQETSYFAYDGSGNPDYVNSWIAGARLTPLALTRRTTPYDNFDAWQNPHPFDQTDQVTGVLTSLSTGTYGKVRVAEDVVLNNVLSFDVKAWDPGAPILRPAATGPAILPGDPAYAAALSGGASKIGYGAFADLNYMCLLGPGSNPWQPSYTSPSGAPSPLFNGPGALGSGLPGTKPYAKDFSSPIDWPTDLRPAVYDTWSTHYESDTRVWIDRNGNTTEQAIEVEGDQNRNGMFNEGTNGFDDNGDGVVDDAGEKETSPPYPVPLRAIQVKIRVFEPDSRQIREVTIVQKFRTS